MGQKRHSFIVEALHVEIYPDRKAMGEAAANAVAEKMKELLLFSVSDDYSALRQSLGVTISVEE